MVKNIDHDKYAGFISHRIFLSQNIIKAMDVHCTDYTADKIAKRIIKGQTVRVDEIEDLSRRYGLTIGDAFIRPGVKTAWYGHSRTIYMPFNVQAYRKEKGMTREELSYRTSRCGLKIINSIENGYVYATISQTQDVANALEVEISDLFLPPDGLD